MTNRRLDTAERIHHRTHAMTGLWVSGAGQDWRADLVLVTTGAVYVTVLEFL